MSAQINLQSLEPSQYYLNASQAHLLILEVLAEDHLQSSQETSIVVCQNCDFPILEPACSQHCASFQMLLSASLALKTIFVTEASLHQSLLFVCCPYCELTPEYSRLMIIYSDFYYSIQTTHYPHNLSWLSKRDWNGRKLLQWEQGTYGDVGSLPCKSKCDRPCFSEGFNLFLVFKNEFKILRFFKP